MILRYDIKQCKIKINLLILHVYILRYEIDNMLLYIMALNSKNYIIIIQYNIMISI